MLNLTVTGEGGGILSTTGVRELDGTSSADQGAIAAIMKIKQATLTPANAEIHKFILSPNHK